MSIVFIVYKLT